MVPLDTSSPIMHRRAREDSVTDVEGKEATSLLVFNSPKAAQQMYNNALQSPLSRQRESRSENNVHRIHTNLSVSTMSMGSHSIGSPRSVFMPLSQLTPQRNSVKHNLIPPTATDEISKDSEANKIGFKHQSKPGECRFRPIVSADERGRAKQIQQKQKKTEVNKSSISSRARKRNQVPFDEIYIEEMSVVSEITHAFQADFGPVSSNSISRTEELAKEHDELIKRLEQMKTEKIKSSTSNLGQNEGISKEEKNNDLSPKVKNMSADDLKKRIRGASLESNRRALSLMQETDELLNELGSFQLQPNLDSNERAKESKENESQAQSLIQDSAVLLDELDSVRLQPHLDERITEGVEKSTEVRNLITKSGSREDKFDSAKLQPHLRIEQELDEDDDQLLSLEEEDKPAILNDMMKEHDKDEDDDQLLSLEEEDKPAILSSSKIGDGDSKENVANGLLSEHRRQDQQLPEAFERRKGAIHKVQKEKHLSQKYSELDGTLLIQSDTDTTSYLDDDDEGYASFNPPVKFVYIPRIPRMNVSNQPKQPPQQKTVRSKSANDKKIKDILSKGRERFLRKNSFRSISNVN